MSKIKTTALALLAVLTTTAGVASAAPRPDRFERVAYDRGDRYGRYDRYDVRDRDRGYDLGRRGAADDLGPRRYRSTWVSLASSLQLGGRGGASDTIQVRDPGTFTQLRLQSTGGRADIDRVIVRFADGSRQVADLDRTLGASSQMIELPLDGNNRRIAQITVVGASDRRGALQIFAI